MQGKVDDIRITLRIQNNRPYAQNVNFLGNPYNLLDTANAHTEYRWDMTALVFTGDTSLTIQYKPVGAGAFALYTIYITQVQSQNIAGVVAALNTLGIGYFTSFTSGASTYIDTNNDDYVFGDISVFGSSTPQLMYSWLTSSGGGNNNIDVNAVNQVTNANPTTASGSVTIAAGDSVHFYGTTSMATSVDCNVMVLNVTTGVFLYNVNLGASAPFTFTFTAVAGNVYQLSVSY